MVNAFDEIGPIRIMDGQLQIDNDGFPCTQFLFMLCPRRCRRGACLGAWPGGPRMLRHAAIGHEPRH